jgi:acetyl coenzyme A synthetase (ADP forming)-like protein
MTLQTLFSPSTVAVIGASATPEKVGHAVLANLLAGGFEGKIVPVNPSSDEILGIKCYRSLEFFSGEIDLAVIAVPIKAVKPSVVSCLDRGATSIIVITAGFKEVDETGAALEREISELCKAKGARLMGPNCLGIINTQNHMNASLATTMPRRGNASVISQSGALCAAILDWVEGRHLGLAKLVSLGNKADLDEVDFLTELSDDRQTKVIVGYLESISSGDKFIQVAESVSTKKPIVILKSGTSRAGSKAASSHTGSLGGADIAYGAAFKRSGIIRADNFEKMLDYATAFAMQPLPKGDRVAIITNAGGPGIMAADAVEQTGMRVAVLKGATASALKAKLPSAASVGNPINVLGDADPKRYSTAIRAALEDDTVDALIVILTPQFMTHPAETAHAITETINGEKPVFAVFMGGKEVMPGRAKLAASNLPDYSSPGRAVHALKAMVDYSAWLNKPPRVVKRYPVNRRRTRRIINRYSRLDRSQVGEADAKEILRAYDFIVPKGKLTTSLEDTLEAAEELGYPLAMKIVSPDIVHKTDMGGVKLDLANADQVADAFDLIMLRIKRNAPKARLQGVYLEKMVKRGLEVIIGMSRDPQFGPMLMFGLGGIFVEVMKDVAFHLAPITADEALQMLESTRSYTMLKGARGQKEVDLMAIAGGLQRMSQLVTDFPEIEELDINPFIVGTTGTKPVVADAQITLTGKGK